MLQGDSRWVRFAKVWLWLTMLAWCLFLPSLFHSYFADDDIYLAFSNRFLRDLEIFDLYELLFRPANAWEFLPVRDFSYWVDLQLYGDDSFGFHLSNLMAYAASGLCGAWMFNEALELYRPQWREKHLALAALGVAFFLVHPAHVEAVVWISGRKDILAGGFSLASLALMLRAQRLGSPIFLLASLLAFLLACFSKSVAITLLVPLCAILIQWRRSGRFDRSIFWLVLWSLCGIAGGAAVIHLHFGYELGVRLENTPGVWSSLERASRILHSLIEMMFFPHDLGIYHDVYRARGGHWIVSLAAISLSMLACWRVWRDISALWPVGCLVCISPLLTYLQFAPFNTWSMASERFVFFAIAGLLLCALDFAGRLRRPVVLGLICIFFFFPLAAVSWHRIGEWESTSSLAQVEYRRMPTHFNAVRDFVFFGGLSLDDPLIDEAVARTEREDARSLLRLLVDAERLKRHEAGGAASIAYCQAVLDIDALRKAGGAALRYESDIPFGGILRFVDRHLYYSHGNPKRRCEKVG